MRPLKTRDGGSMQYQVAQRRSDQIGTSASFRGTRYREEHFQLQAHAQYKSLRVLEFMDSWTANLRRCLSRIFRETFMRDLKLNTEEMQALGVSIRILEHQKGATQNDFGELLDTMTTKIRRLNEQRIGRIKRQQNQHTGPMAEKAALMGRKLVERLGQEFTDFRSLNLRDLLYRCGTHISAHESRELARKRNASKGGTAAASPAGSPFQPKPALGLAAFSSGSGGSALTQGFIQSPPAGGSLIAATAQSEAENIIADYDRAFYFSLLSLRKFMGRRVNLIKERQRLEKYLLVNDMEGSRGYVLARLRQLLLDGHFGRNQVLPSGQAEQRNTDPSDSAILLHVFCTYMEERLRVSNFRAEYTINYDDWLRQTERSAPLKFLIVSRDPQPMHLRILRNGREIEVRPGKENFFEAVALFFYFLDTDCSGLINQVDVYTQMSLAEDVFDDKAHLGGAGRLLDFFY